MFDKVQAGPKRGKTNRDKALLNRANCFQSEDENELGARGETAEEPFFLLKKKRKGKESTGEKKER